MGSSWSTASPEPGDLIEISRTLYQHWAVYIGNGLVVNVQAIAETAGDVVDIVLEHGRAVVKQQPLREVVAGDEYRVNNELDYKYKPRRPAEIVADAKSRVGQEMSYSILEENCEDFATNLRYGIAESRQAQNALRAFVMFTLIGSALGLANFLYGLLGGKKRRNRLTEGAHESTEPSSLG